MHVFALNRQELSRCLTDRIRERDVEVHEGDVISRYCSEDADEIVKNSG